MNSEILPVFSGGVGRSGTTLIGRILRNHKDVLAGSPFEIKFLTESHGLIDLVFGIRNFRKTQISRKGYFSSKIAKFESRKIRFFTFRRRMHEDWWIRTNRLGRESGIHRALTKVKLEELLEALESDLDKPVEAARNFLFGYIRNHRLWQGESVWIDTTPANILYADHLYRIFPEARFVQMKRNPLDNIASVLKEPWGPNTKKLVLDWWCDRIELSMLARESIPSTNYLSLFLEDLVHHKRNESLKNLFDLINLDEDLKVMEYFQNEVSADRANINRWRMDFKKPERFKSRFYEKLEYRKFDYSDYLRFID